MIYGSVSTGSHIEKLVFEDELGWECAFVSEIDKYANQVIRYHCDTPNLGDFSKIKADDRTTRIELLSGGTPCQDFSVAGLRAGLAGERGGLTVEFLKLVDRLRPTWFLWENVPGVLSSWHPEEDSAEEARWIERNAFDQFLAGIRHIGYYAAWRVLDAQYFGVPQRRRRVFVVGHIGDWRRAAAVLLEPESVQGHPAPSREAGAGTTQALTRGFANGGADDNKAQGGFLVSAPVTTSPHADHEAQESKLIPEISHALTAQKTATGRLDPNGETFIPEAYQCHGSNVGPMGAVRAGNGNETGGVPFCVTGERTHALKAEGSDASEDGTGRGTPIIAFSCKDDGRDATEDMTPTLRSMGRQDGSPKCNGNGHMAVAYESINRETDEAKTVPTEADTREVLRELQESVGEEAFVKWCSGVALSLREEEVLRSEVHEGSVSGTLEEGCERAPGQIPSEDDSGSGRVREVRVDGEPGCSSQGRRPPEQRSVESRGAVPELPHQDASVEDMLDYWMRSEAQRSRVLRKALSALQEMGRSYGCEDQPEHPSLKVRRLMPIECERLMGWPDDWTRYGRTQKGELVEISDTQRYKIIGNGWARPCIRWIAQRISLINAH